MLHCAIASKFAKPLILLREMKSTASGIVSTSNRWACARNTPITHASESIEPLDEAARIYAAYFNDAIVGTIRGNRFSDLPTAYYRKLYRIDDRFPLRPDEMSLTTKLMFDPALRRSLYPIRLIVHYARDFNARRPCKIDFVDCRRWLLPFFLKLGYVDYLGWVFHNEYGSVRPLFCPADQVLRLQRLRSPLAAVARDFCDNNMFGGEDLIRRLALVGRRAAQPIRRLRAERCARSESPPEDHDVTAG